MRELTIQTKQLQLVNLVPNSEQTVFLQTVAELQEQRRPIRIIILKARQLGMCLAPETRVLTADLRWVTIDDVSAGSELVSVDEEGPGGKGHARRMRRAVVEAKREVVEPAFEITMGNGQALVATGGHRFMVRARGAVHTQWRRVDKMRAGDVIRYVTEPWDEATVDDGWMGGFLDGEGSCRPKTRAGVEVTLAQGFGPVYDRAASYLRERGYTFREEVDGRPLAGFSRKPVGRLVLGRMNEIFRLFGQTRPTRFIERGWWEDKELPGKRSGRSWADVRSIRPVGTQRMIDLQTSTKTFIAEGFVSHNSTAVCGLFFWWAWFYQHLNALVVAHESDPTLELFSKIDLMWEHFPYKDLDRARNRSAGKLKWDKRGSQIKVATAENVKTGRSLTLHAVHLSEVAFYSDPETLMTGLNEAIPFEPGTIVIKESTANGTGNHFARAWDAAVAGDSEYVALFFPWQYTREYTASHIGLPIQLGSLTPEEKILRSLGVDDDHLAWRRFKLVEMEYDLDKFRQEYPATPEEAFVASGANVFDLEALELCKKPVPYMRGELEADRAGNVTFQSNPAGRLRVYMKPSRDRARGIYLAAGDPTWTTKGDYGCVQVINRRTYEQVATWHGRIDPMNLATVMRDIGHYYNDAMLVPETTGPGYATAGALFQMGYPNLWINKFSWEVTGHIQEMPGWQSNVKSKEFAIGFLRTLIRQKLIAIHDDRTYKEARVYVHLGGKDLYGPADNASKDEKFDDTVMPLAIACAASNLSGGILPYEEARRDLESAQQSLIAGVHGWPGSEQ